MKKIITLSIMMCLVFTAYSQTKKAAPSKAAPTKAAPVKENPAKEDPDRKMVDSPDPVNQDEINAKMMAAMTPGEEHAMLASQVGDWTEEITMWMHETAEPIVNQAKVKVEMILDGRYQQTLHSGEFMGMHFEGVGVTGYDNVSKKYYSTWIDNMGTGVMFSTGTMDPKTKAIQYLGEQSDPISGKTVKIREVMTFIGESEMHLDMYSTPLGGKEFLSMRIVMKR
ncbi:MAG: DUF1579 domain-containing protein [Bacteroidetes bacterium]|nr:DUF1579 domain-containing protein [Bacteroidota bacterium]